jgi:hypothetical protein
VPSHNATASGSNSWGAAGDSRRSDVAHYGNVDLPRQLTPAPSTSTTGAVGAPYSHLRDSVRAATWHLREGVREPPPPASDVVTAARLGHLQSLAR